MRTPDLPQIRKACVAAWKQLRPHLFAHRCLLLTMLFIALAIRIFFALYADIRPPNIDLLVHNQLAVEGGFDKYRAPLYPVFLRSVYFVFGRYNYRVLFSIQGLMSTLTVFLIYWTAMKLCGRRTGVIAASICTVYPDLINYNQTITPIPLVMFIISLLAAVSATGFARTHKSYLTAFLLGLGILTMPPLIFLVPGYLIVTHKRVGFLLILLVTLTPWALRNSVTAHEFVPIFDESALGLDTSKFTHVKSGWDTVEKLYTNVANTLGKRHADKVYAELISNTKDSRFTRVWGYVICAILGLIGMIRHFRKEHATAVLPFILYMALIILFSVVKAVDRIPLLPMWFMYASALIVRKCEQEDT